MLGAAALLLGSCKNSRMEPMEEKESLNEVVQGRKGIGSFFRIAWRGRMRKRRVR